MRNLTSIIAVAMTTIATETVNAQYHQKAEQNPYTLVYDGAITENVKGKVNIHPVTYKLNGIELIDQPLLMMAGSKADTKYMTDEAFDKATNAKNKELFLIEGATHIETYWKPEYVKQAVDKLVKFYQTNL